MTFVAAMILSLALQDQDRIQDLIKKLGSEEFSTRERATEELKKAGKSAREALQKAAEESEDPEIRQRSKDILEEMAKAPAPRKPVPTPGPLPGRPGVRGGSVSVRSVNGDTTYTISPADGSPALTFYKAAAGAVKLTYADEQGESKTVEAASVASLVKDHAELAQKFGISEEGIDYAGSRVSFKGATPFAIPRVPRPLPPVPPVPPVPAEDPEPTPVAGAWLSPVDESLRAQLDIPAGQGAVVTKVTAGGIAEGVGLRKNDVLLGIDGRAIGSPEAAKGRMKKDSSVVVLRKGKRETLTPKKDF